jgi:hypothetical protein
MLGGFFVESLNLVTSVWIRMCEKEFLKPILDYVASIWIHFFSLRRNKTKYIKNTKRDRMLNGERQSIFMKFNVIGETEKCNSENDTIIM